MLMLKSGIEAPKKPAMNAGISNGFDGIDGNVIEKLKVGKLQRLTGKVLSQRTN